MPACPHGRSAEAYPGQVAGLTCDMWSSANGIDNRGNTVLGVSWDSMVNDIGNAMQ